MENGNDACAFIGGGGCSFHRRVSCARVERGGGLVEQKRFALRGVPKLAKGARKLGSPLFASGKPGVYPVFKSLSVGCREGFAYRFGSGLRAE